MRITIETDDEPGRGEIPAETSTKPDHVEPMDAGAPPESLTQVSTAGSPPLSVAGSSEGRDAGPPPEWLLEAVQSATPMSVEAEGTDAGAAPDMST
jgi:hypothetical protein